MEVEKNMEDPFKNEDVLMSGDAPRERKEHNVKGEMKALHSVKPLAYILESCK